MGLFSNNSGVMDVIRCDEQNYLIWKWRPDNSELGERNRENAIRWGSSLIVKEGSVAIFLHRSKEGLVRDYIEGPADITVSTKNLPVISSVIGLAYNNKSPFQAEVYFVNLAKTIQIRFAVPYFDVFDSELREFSVPVAVRGSLDFNIENYKRFIKIHRLDNFSINDLQAQIRDTVSENVKGIIANAPDDYEIPVIHLEKRIMDIKEDLTGYLAEKLYYDYGISLSDLNIEAIDIDKDSEGYRELKEVTKELTSAKIKKRTKAQITAESREIKSSQTIGMIGKAAEMIVDVTESQFERRKRAESEYSDVIEDKRAGKIGAIGGKMIRDIGNAFNGSNKSSKETPPPIPKSALYNVVIKGKPAGPYDVAKLEKLIAKGTVTANSLVWTKGMEDWEKAGNIDELSILFDEMPPIPEE